MKKLFSLLLILSMLFTTPVCFADASEEMIITSYETEIGELKAIGILNDTFDPLKVVTRGEFTKFLITLSGLSDAGVYGNNVYFYDVPQANEYFSSVSYCVEKGYVSGYPDGLFRPNNGITPEEAIKVLVHTLGYDYLSDVSGSGYTAYIEVAQRIGLTKGINLPYGEILLGGEVAKLIHNTLDIPLVLMTGINGDSGVYEINEDKTILSEMFSMGKVSGVVYSTSITGYMGYSVSDEKYAIVGNETLYSEENLAWEYLGYNVDVLYKINKEKERKEILTILKNDKNKIIEISKEDFLRIDNGKLYYNLNEKEENISVTRFFEFIYNGKAKTYDTSLIKDAKYGRFTVISNDGSNEYKTVMFDSFTTLYVDRVEVDNETVYSKNSFLELNNDEKLIVLKDSFGNRITVNDIKVGDVIIYYINNDYIFGYKSENKLTLKPDAVNTVDKTIEAEGKEYEFAPDVVSDLFKYVAFNKTYNVYLDIFGKIGFIEVLSGEQGEILLSYGVENGSGEIDEDIFIVAFSLNSMKKERIQVRNNVMVNGVLQKDVERAFLKDALVKGQPFVVRKNESGLITHIETARSKDSFSDEEDGFIAHFYQSSTNHFTTKAYFSDNADCLNNQVFCNANTKLLVMPEDFKNAEEKDFTFGELWNDGVSNLNVASYSFSKESVYADLLIVPSSVYNKNTGRDVSKSVIVLEIREAVDEMGEPVKKLTYLCENEEDFVYIYSDMTSSNEYGMESTFWDEANKKSTFKISNLQKGDMINFTKDSHNRMLSYNLVFDHNNDLNNAKIIYDGASATSYADPYRATTCIFFAEIADINGEFIKLKLISPFRNNKETSTNANEVDGGRFYQRHTDIPITALSISGGHCTVEEGSFSDLVKGKKIIYYTYSGEATSIIVLK